MSIKYIFKYIMNKFYIKVKTKLSKDYNNNLLQKNADKRFWAGKLKFLLNFATNDSSICC